MFGEFLIKCIIRINNDKNSIVRNFGSVMGGVSLVVLGLKFLLFFIIVNFRTFIVGLLVVVIGVFFLFGGCYCG